MVEDKVEKIDELVSQVIGRNKKVVNTKITRLLAPGENNVSLMLRVDYTIKNEETGCQEELHTVAKIIPIMDITKNVFKNSFKHEVSFYNIVVPTLQEFQRRQGVKEVIDLFPKFYAYRPNLHGKSDEVDDDAIMMLENLAVLGYKNVDRFVGFDLIMSKSVLKDLALFHAVPLALRRVNPELYSKKLAPHFETYKPFKQPKDEKPKNDPSNAILELIEESDEISQFLEIVKPYAEFKFHDYPRDGLFTSIAHRDMWVNNIMTKFENGRPIKNKFVDFQMHLNFSLAIDVFFFLWSSVQESVLENSLDDLLKFYYDNLIENLQKLKCDTGPYTYEKYLEEIKRTCKLEIGHVIMKTYFVVFGKKGGQVDDNDPSKPASFATKKNVTPEGRRKVAYMIKQCIKRGWL